MVTSPRPQWSEEEPAEDEIEHRWGSEGVGRTGPAPSAVSSTQDACEVNWAGRLLTKPWFEPAIGLIIAINALVRR